MKMDLGELETLVVKIIATYLECEPTSIQNSTLLEKELEIDSTELIGIVVETERALGVSLKKINYTKAETPADLASEINRHLLVGEVV